MRKNGNESAMPHIHKGGWYGEADGYADGHPVYDIWSCSECGTYFEEWDDKPTWNFCPCCGADMREVQNEKSRYSENCKADPV